MMQSPRRPTRPTLLLPAFLLAVLLVMGCGDTEGTETDPPPIPPEPVGGGAVPTAPPEPDGEQSALVAVRIEELDGVFTEGFEVALRFETADGDVIDSMLWSDLLAEQEPSSPTSAYDLVLDQPVPVGDVVVFAEATVGAGPPPSVPDVGGELPCSLELQLAENERAELEIRFDRPEDCLHRLDA